MSYDFKTERLHLHIIGADDSDAVFETMNWENTAEIVSFMKWPMTMEQAEDFCRLSENGIKDSTDFVFLAVSKNEEANIGCTGVHLDQEGDGAEIGYWISESHQRQGYATEILAGAVDMAFRCLPIGFLWATTAIQNEPSKKLLERQGFRYMSTIQKPLDDNSVRESRLYRLNKQDRNFE